MTPKPKNRSPLAPSERSVAKWQQVENVVAAVELALGRSPGWVIRQNALIRQRHSARRRQVDVYVECPSGPRAFSIGIDVKDTRAPLDVEVVEQLCAKGKGLAVDRYVIVSTGGFTAPALEEARRHGVLTQELRALDLSEVFALEYFTQLIAEVSGVDVLHEAPLPAINPADLSIASIIIGGVPRSLMTLAGAYAREALQKEPDIPPEILRVLEVRDGDGIWEALVVGDSEFPPPKALRIRWTPHVQRIEGRKFQTADGVEVFTALLPAREELRQISIIATPHESGGKQITITVQDPRPARSEV